MQPINWYFIKQKLKEAPSLTSIGFLGVFIFVLGQLGLISEDITSSNIFVWIIVVMIFIGIFGTLAFYARKFKIINF